MKTPPDFRPYVPTLDYPRVKAMHGRDAHEHGAAGYANPIPRGFLFDPWEVLYNEPFKGVSTNGTPLAGLFERRDHGAPTAAMVEATTRLLAAVTPAQRAALLLPLDAREWRRWNNTEMYVWKYGLRLEEVSLPLREAMLAVMRASLSAKGFEKARDVMRFNHLLGELAMNIRVLGEWSYNFTLFGTPVDKANAATAPWGWQLSGHHLALNCLVIGGQMVLSPAFMGAEPNYADGGPECAALAGKRLFQDEENGGLALIRALSNAQREQAILFHATTGGNLPAARRHRADQLHLGGAFQDNRVVPYEGAPVSSFSKAQRKQLLDLVNAYIEPLPEGPRTARIEEIERHLDATHFCWIGGTGEDDTFYYRIQSPVVMVEFDHHSGVFLTNELPAKFHIHTIVRTPNGGDYGVDLLRMHYARDHHEQARPGVAGAPVEHKARGKGGSHGQVHGDAHGHAHGHSHSHPHSHDHAPGHTHGHDHDHGYSHSHGHDHGHAHEHGGKYGIKPPPKPRRHE